MKTTGLSLILLINYVCLVTSRRSSSHASTTFASRHNLATTEPNSVTSSLPPPANRNLFHSAHQTTLSRQTRGGAISTPQIRETVGATIFVLLDVFFRRSFRARNIAFPSQLGGCGILLGLLLLLNLMSPGLGDWIFEALSPGAALLAKWLPVFFVPGLALLPLAPPMGSMFEIVKVLAVVIVGFYFSAFTAAFAVLALRKYQGLVEHAPPATSSTCEGATSSLKSKPFSPELVKFLLSGTVLSGAVTIGVSKSDHAYAGLARTLFMSFTTYAAYVCGARLPAVITTVVHPLVTSTLAVFLASHLLGKATDTSFMDVLSTYKTGSLALKSVGAGDILLFLLGPSVVSFAVAIYSRKKVVADNFMVLLIGVLVASAGGLYGTAAFVRAMNLGGELGRILRLSMLARNVTTPLAIAITNIIGGDIAFACGVVVLTGIFGGTFGARILDQVGVRDPVSRGIGIGASAQGLGVASMAKEKEAFPFAAVSMVLTAVMSTVLVSIPVVKDSIVNLAVGK